MILFSFSNQVNQNYFNIIGICWLRLDKKVTCVDYDFEL